MPASPLRRLAAPGGGSTLQERRRMRSPWRSAPFHDLLIASALRGGIDILAQRSCAPFGWH